ncbi:MAG TPA: ribose 5-phosphate isomerase B [Thermoanaerobaculia bacterium]|jgi:ribose 5-phosphate isomerase B|nr:ribose 5-phosphate isomerase B [Thermoanaerobaculia bacterium]
MKIAVGADHAGFELKEKLKTYLASKGHEVQDLGTSSSESVDYPDFGFAVGRAVASGQVERGVLACGTGIGIAIAANKVKGVRAGTPNDLFATRLMREHNDANVISFGARQVAPTLAEAMLDVFLSTPFEGGGRHERRVGKLNAAGGTE